MEKIATTLPVLEAFDEVIRNLQKNVADFVDSPAFKMNMAIAKSVNDTMKRNQDMFQSAIANMPKITLPSSTLYLPQLSLTSTVLKPRVELVGGSDLLAVKGISQAKRKQTRLKKAFGLYFIAGHSVQYGRRTLKGFSLETQAGQLLSMLLEADGHFVSDEKLLRVFKKLVIADIGHIRRNLKNTLEDNDLQIIIERRKNSKGYVLVDIKEIATKTD